MSRLMNVGGMSPGALVRMKGGCMCGCSLVGDTGVVFLWDLFYLRGFYYFVCIKK